MTLAPGRDYNTGMALMNLDAGEHDDEPEELWAKFDVLNIACGGHAGDAASMERVVAWCVRAGRVPRQSAIGVIFRRYHSKRHCQQAGWMKDRVGARATPNGS